VLTGKLIPFRKQKDGTLELTRIEGKREARGLELADAVMACLLRHEGRSRGELEEAAKSIDIAPNERVLREGLFKLFTDGAVFNEPRREDAEERRRTLFLEAGEARKAGTFDRTALLKRHGLGPEDEALRVSLYGDLPGEAVLTAAPRWPRETWAERYNEAIEQGAVAAAESVTFTIAETNLRALPPFLRKLKFHGLLCSLTHAEGLLHIEVSGPSSLFTASARYGMSISSLLPHLKPLTSFTLQAVVRTAYGDRERFRWSLVHVLQAGAASKATLLDELKVLCTRFGDLESEWKLSRADEVLCYAGGDLAVPDLKAKSGKREVFLEFFGPWSRERIFARLEKGAPRTLAGKEARILLCAPAKARIKESVAETGTDPETQGLYVYKRAASAEEIEERLSAIYPKP
jgi:uncharacterized protein